MSFYSEVSAKFCTSMMYGVSTTSVMCRICNPDVLLRFTPSGAIYIVVPSQDYHLGSSDTVHALSSWWYVYRSSLAVSNMKQESCNIREQQYNIEQRLM